GIAYRNQGKHDRAIADFDEAIKLKPDYAVAMYNRGTTYYDKLDYDRAIASFDAVIKLDPSNVLALHDRGVARYDQHNYDRAIADFDQLVKSGVGLVVAQNKDRSAERLTSYDRSSGAAPRQLKLNTSYAQAFNARGLEFSSKGEFDKAIAE